MVLGSTRLRTAVRGVVHVHDNRIKARREQHIRSSVGRNRHVSIGEGLVSVTVLALSVLEPRARARVRLCGSPTWVADEEAEEEEEAQMTVPNLLGNTVRDDVPAQYRQGMGILQTELTVLSIVVGVISWRPGSHWLKSSAVIGASSVISRDGHLCIVDEVQNVPRACS